MTMRKRHPEEFKREALRLLEERGDRPLRAVAQGLGVAESQLYGWRKKYGQIVEGRLNHRGESAERELQRLRQEVSKRAHGLYGSPRIARELVAQGKLVGRHRTAHLIRNSRCVQCDEHWHRASRLQVSFIIATAAANAALGRMSTHSPNTA